MIAISVTWCRRWMSDTNIVWDFQLGDIDKRCDKIYHFFQVDLQLKDIDSKYMWYIAVIQCETIDCQCLIFIKFDPGWYDSNEIEENQEIQLFIADTVGNTRNNGFPLVWYKNDTEWNQVIQFLVEQMAGLTAIIWCTTTTQSDNAM